MQLLQTEGIILQALAFKERDYILTIFTPNGIQKFYSKGTKRYNPLTTLLTVGEFIYSLGKKDLHHIQDGTVIDQNLKLRESLDRLIYAEKLTKAILQTQMYDKPAFDLYRMFRIFLNGLSHFNDPEKLHTAFCIKLMKHEGILELNGSYIFRFGGERYEKNEAPLGAEEMAREEEAILQQIAQCKTLEEIDQIVYPQGFSKKIETLYQQAFIETFSF